MNERQYIRILRIPPGTDKDSEGRGYGSDWLLCQLGRDDNGNDVWVTTSYVRGSEYAELGLDLETCAEVIRSALQAHCEKRAQEWRDGKWQYRPCGDGMQICRKEQNEREADRTT